jgi:hypothetical protein
VLLALLYFDVVFTLPAPLGLGIQWSAGDHLACIAGRGGFGRRREVNRDPRSTVSQHRYVCCDWREHVDHPGENSRRSILQAVEDSLLLLWFGWASCRIPRRSPPQ